MVRRANQALATLAPILRRNTPCTTPSARFRIHHILFVRLSDDQHGHQISPWMPTGPGHLTHPHHRTHTTTIFLILARFVRKTSPRQRLRRRGPFLITIATIDTHTFTGHNTGARRSHEIPMLLACLLACFFLHCFFDTAISHRDVILVARAQRTFWAGKEGSIDCMDNDSIISSLSPSHRIASNRAGVIFC